MIETDRLITYVKPNEILETITEFSKDLTHNVLGFWNMEVIPLPTSSLVRYTHIAQWKIYLLVMYQVQKAH